MMKIALLTTETTHHTFFAWRMGEHMPISAIFVETASISPPFDTGHPFERLREEYERDVLLREFAGGLRDIAATHAFDSLNDKDAVCALEEMAPDVAVVFGTGRLGNEVVGAPRVACLNLHGGNPERYRGLDTHLWAIYHRDFDDLVTTLHHVDAELDTGDVVLRSRVPISKESKLYELRAANTQICLNLTVSALHTLRVLDWLPSYRQRKRGRYYSFMPAPLKDVCVRRFEDYVESL